MLILNNYQKSVQFDREKFMFKHRSDGVFAKSADPILGMTSHIMRHRYDAMVQFLFAERCEKMDEYIRKKAEEGIRINYMHILIASLVRLYAEKPKINRFVMNGRVFQRKGIYICFTMKKQLSENAPEDTVKMRFTGEETLLEIKQKIDDEISASRSKSSDTEKTAKLLKMIPNGLTKFVVNLFKFMDLHGCMPKKIIGVSPFHTGAWVTNMKSISTDYVYHHLYDFGTSSMFVGLGKEHIEPVVNEQTEEIEKGKVIKLGLVIDERICDGFYYAKSIKLVRRFMQNPELLDKPFALTNEQKLWNYEGEKLKQFKKQQKIAKKQQKLQRREQKRQSASQNAV